MKTKIFSLLFFASFIILNSCSKDDDPIPPVATATPMSQDITSGMATSIALTSSVSGTTFSFTVVQSGVTGAISGSGASIAQTLTLTGSVAGTATYTITPTAEGTMGTPISVVVKVNPAKTTYMANVKSLLTTSCAPCHIAGGGNPNKFDDYTTTKNKINSILDRVQRESTAAGFMPKGGAKLSAENIALLNKWVADGLLEK